MGILISLIVGVVIGWLISNYMSKDKITQLRASIESDLLMKNKRIEDLQVKISEIKEQWDKCSNDLTNSNKKVEKLLDDNEDLEDEVDKLKKEARNQKAELENYTVKLEECTELFEFKNKELEDLKRENSGK